MHKLVPILLLAIAVPGAALAAEPTASAAPT